MKRISRGQSANRDFASATGASMAARPPPARAPISREAVARSSAAVVCRLARGRKAASGQIGDSEGPTD